MPEAKPAGRGRKLAKAVAVQAPEAKPSPVQIGPSKDAPEAADPNRAGRRRHSAPRRPACSADGNPSTSFRARADRGAPSPAPGGPRQAFSTSHVSGQTVSSRLPAWTALRTKDGTLARAPLGQAPHRIRSGAMPSASSSPPSTAAPTRRRRPAPGRLTARRGALTRAQWRRRERSEATEQTRGSAGCEHPAGPHHLAPTGPAGRRSKIEDHKDVPVRGGRRGAG